LSRQIAGINMEFKNLFKPLSKGDKIGIASVSGKTDCERILRGRKILEELGYGVVLSENIDASFRYMSGSDEKRVKGFSALLNRSDIKAVIFARGGYGVFRILDKIDFSEIDKFSGFFMGYSDNSILLNLISEKTGKTVFHGPNLSEIDKADSLLIKNIFNGNILKNISSEFIFFNEGKASGVLAGGNLASFASLCGTAHNFEFKDKILFIEDVNEPLYKIDRMLTQMRLSGCFKGIRGVIAGSFEGCGNMDSISELLIENFNNVPVVHMNSFGHGALNNPLLLGTSIEINSYEKRVNYV
jgi:muramoyltetrapeptide carboxypeptidase